MTKTDNISVLLSVTALLFFSGCATTGSTVASVQKERAPIAVEKEKELESKTDGKLDAISRIKEALEVVVAGPIAGAYIGTAGGNLPTYEGLVGGATVGGIWGIMSGIHILVTGEPMKNDETEATPQYAEKKLITRPSSSQTLKSEGLVGTWRGEFYRNRTWAREISVRIETKDNQSYAGRILKFGIGGINPDCTGAKINLNRPSGNLYTVTFNRGGACKVKGKLKYTGHSMKGKIYVKGWAGGPVTLNLSRVTG